MSSPKSSDSPADQPKYDGPTDSWFQEMIRKMETGEIKDPFSSDDDSESTNSIGECDSDRDESWMRERISRLELQRFDWKEEKKEFKAYVKSLEQQRNDLAKELEQLKWYLAKSPAGPAVKVVSPPAEPCTSDEAKAIELLSCVRVTEANKKRKR